MRQSLVFISLLVASCPLDSDLVRVCNQPVCWIDHGDEIRTDAPPFELGIECHLGTVVCEEGDIVGCRGFEGPHFEECNALDDDCNGFADDDLFVAWFDSENTCNGEGVCATADQECLGGEWQCTPVLLGGEEVCDDLDNDCNGSVDDGISTEFFYPEDQYPNTVGLGECRPGIRRCVRGEEETTPAVIPHREQCGTNLDEDCDGLADEREGGNLEGEFVLAIDLSGSMSGYIDAVTEAVCDWSSDAEFSWSSFAVIGIGDGTIDSPFVSIVQDFSDAASTCATLSDIDGLVATSTGAEFQPAGILLSEELSWGATLDKYVVVFTDEAVQVTDSLEVSDVRDSCQVLGYEVGVFTSPAHFYQWDSMVEACGGFEDYLTVDGLDMADALRGYFNGSC